MSERLTKKQLKEDRFLETIQSALTYAQENLLVVVTGLVAFVALVVLAVRIGGSAAGIESSSVNVEAQRDLSEARIELSQGRLETGTEALEQVRQRWKRDDAGREATYILANAYFQAGRYGEARRIYEEFLENPLHDELMRDGARLGIAACLEETGDLAGAQDAYASLWTEGLTPGSRIEGALAAARCAEAQGRTDRARELLEGVAQTYPDAPEAEEARFELLRLTGGESS
jgi:pentatricopeptide repeat protein